ncbi:hypothetical protein PFISCL1PPCAC_17894 [Pristionchus fissidentatus]|uniref:G protein-coupled receptor n=1 Tax=Pristionchus fissidentatus TaxID=1538716 RepID=A0AAV5W6J4_9BILA|nr:hypothetical protein PFISCL1PPCAC_17894 [Pristionchus fissidentatus]
MKVQKEYTNVFKMSSCRGGVLGIHNVYSFGKAFGPLRSSKSCTRTRTSTRRLSSRKAARIHLSASFRSGEVPPRSQSRRRIDYLPTRRCRFGEACTSSCRAREIAWSSVLFLKIVAFAFAFVDKHYMIIVNINSTLYVALNEGIRILLYHPIEDFGKLC